MKLFEIVGREVKRGIQQEHSGFSFKASDGYHFATLRYASVCEDHPPIISKDGGRIYECDIVENSDTEERDFNRPYLLRTPTERTHDQAFVQWNNVVPAGDTLHAPRLTLNAKLFNYHYEAPSPSYYIACGMSAKSDNLQRGTAHIIIPERSSAEWDMRDLYSQWKPYLLTFLEGELVLTVNATRTILTPPATPEKHPFQTTRRR